MPGFPLMALGAGLGQFAQQYAQQQAQREREMMLQITLAKFQQEQQDRQENRDIQSGTWDLPSGGSSPVSPVGTPMSGGSPGGGTIPQGDHWTPAGLNALRPTEGRYDQIHYPSGRAPSGVKSSASGGYGFLDGTWREFAPKAGVDLTQYPRAYLAPPEVQDKVAAITPITHWTGVDNNGRPFNSAAQRIAANPAYVTGGRAGRAAGRTEDAGGAPADRINPADYPNPTAWRQAVDAQERADPGGTRFLPREQQSFDTPLSPAEEMAFNAWKARYAPNDSGEDYDLRGAFKAGLTPNPTTGHFPDTFKKPNHPTFSNQSKYAAGANAARAGSWQGETFVPSGSREPQMAQAGPQTATDAGTMDAIDAQERAELAKIPMPKIGNIDLDAIRQRIQQARPNGNPYIWSGMLENYLKHLKPELQQKFQTEVKQYDAQIAAVRESAKERRSRAEWDRQHNITRKEKLEDQETAPGPIIRGGPGGETPYVVNPRTRKAAPIIDETTGQPLTDAQRLSGGGASSLSGDRAKDLVTETKRLDDEFSEANPGASKAEKDAAHYNNRLKAEQRLAQAKTSETRSTLANIAMRKLRDEHPEWDGKDLLRESSKIIAQQAIDRRYAGGQGANQMASLNTVADHLRLMSEYSEALRTGAMPFTEIPRLNQIIQFAAKERGMPEVTNFNVARDIMADEVVRLLTSTGGTEADRAGMQSRLAAAMSEYQQTGALTAFERFTAGRFKGLEQGYARNNPERIKDFRETMLTSEARAIFTKHAGDAEPSGAAPPGGAAAPAGGGKARTIVIQNGMRFDKDTGEYLGQANP
jgi:hypothetical protein